LELVIGAFGGPEEKAAFTQESVGLDALPVYHGSGRIEMIAYLESLPVVTDDFNPSHAASTPEPNWAAFFASAETESVAGASESKEAVLVKAPPLANGFNQLMSSGGEGTRSLSVMQKRIGLLAGHMSHQRSQHQKALVATNRGFEQLLIDLEPTAAFFREAFALRGVPPEQIYTEIDPDRSVGMIRVLWHTISFTARGNSQPLALFRPGRDPIFTGRILAIRGDFQEISLTWDPQHFQELLPFEISSLYIPADETDPAVMKIPHLGNEEHYFHQSEAARMFLMKTIEMVCGGGFLHEQ
jgi:hypothetical protein